MTGSVFVVCAALAATPITLEEAKKEARNNTQALVALLEHQRAQEHVRVSRSAIFPHVSLSATAGGGLNGPQTAFSTVPELDPASGAIVGFSQRSVDVQASSSRASFELSASVSQLIYDGGRWWNQIAQSQAVSDAQQGQAKEQALASELEAVRRFYELYRAQEVLRLLQANATRSEELLERARFLFEAGRVQGVDVTSAQVNLGNDRLAVVQQETRIADAQGALAVWLSRPGAQELQATAPPFEPGAPAPDVATALETARAQRPLLQAAESSLEAARLATKVARADYLPQVAVQATAGRQGPTADPFFTDLSRQNFLQGGLQIRWDLFSGFATQARTQQAEIARRRAELEWAQAVRELEAEVRTGVVRYGAQVSATRIAEGNVDAARRGLELATARFEAGAGSTIEVRDAQLKLTQAELTLLQNRIDVEIARAALARSLGTGAQP